MHIEAKNWVQTYISLGLGLAVVGFGTRHLGGWVRVHFVLQLCNLLRQLFQGLHDVGPLFGFHSSVLLQAVYQSLEEGGKAGKGTVKTRKKQTKRGRLGLLLPSDTQSVSLTSPASSFSCPAGVLMPPKWKKTMKSVQ